MTSSECVSSISVRRSSICVNEKLFLTHPSSSLIMTFLHVFLSDAIHCCFFLYFLCFKHLNYNYCLQPLYTSGGPLSIYLITTSLHCLPTSDHFRPHFGDWLSGLVAFLSAMPALTAVPASFQFGKVHSSPSTSCPAAAVPGLTALTLQCVSQSLLFPHVLSFPIHNLDLWSL